MKFQKPNNTVLNAEDKFGSGRDSGVRDDDLTELGERAIKLLNDKNLKVSKVKPFFWSMVETYVDRFHFYPFDIKRALISYLELKNYPEKTMQELVEQLESQFEEAHGRPLRKSTKSTRKPKGLDAEIKELRDSLKYAAMVAESEEKK
ncbi:MAG: hypothetical protein KAJ32_03425 [Gammaproteobacteria bacterium]|nr:hypothetical protein [Gammaproteobacteria bacterium]